MRVCRDDGPLTRPLPDTLASRDRQGAVGRTGHLMTIPNPALTPSMPITHSIDLIPLGVRLQVEHGGSLEAALAEHGVEFPCGGAGTCRGCRVRVIAKARWRSRRRWRRCSRPRSSRRAGGWRAAPGWNGPLTLEIAQWAAPVLTDESRLRLRAGRRLRYRHRPGHHHPGRADDRSFDWRGAGRGDRAQSRRSFTARMS